MSERHYPIFLLAGNGPYANRGCEAIVRGTVDVLSRRFPEARYILSSFGQSAFEEAAKETDSRIEHLPDRTVYSPPRPGFLCSIWKTIFGPKDEKQDGAGIPYGVPIAALERSDCALLLGGDNYTLDYGRPVSAVELGNALLSRGKPVVLWGASVGPFDKDPEFEEVMRGFLKSLSLVLVRESESLSYLASIGVRENVRRVSDPAFAMPAVRPSLSRKLETLIERGAVGLNLSPLAGLCAGGSQSSWAALATECIRALADADLGPVLLIPHVTINTAYDNDYRFLLECGRRVRGWGSRIVLLPPSYSAAEYKWVISQLVVFCGARMHATIAALSSFVPTLSLGYSIKYQGLNHDIFGHKNWLIPMESLRPELLVDRVRQLVCERDTVVKHLGSRIPDFVRLAHDAAEHLAWVMPAKLSNSG